MPPYRCLNKECELYDKIDRRDSRGFYDRKKGKVVDTGLPCPICGEDSELVLPEKFSSNLILKQW
jgi:hypothetical protein